MLVLHWGRDAVGARALPPGEKRFASLIDERNLFEVNDCGSQRRPVARVFPKRTQLFYPETGEAPMQTPTLPVGSE